MKFMSSENEILFTRLSAKKVMNSLIEIAMVELLITFDQINRCFDNSTKEVITTFFSFFLIDSVT